MSNVSIMDSGIESTENSNGSSNESVSCSLIEVHSDSSSASNPSEMSGNSSSCNYFPAPHNILPSKNSKNHSKEDTDDSCLVPEPRVPANSPENDCLDSTMDQDISNKTWKIPRINISSYDSEFSKPLMPPPEGSCLKLHFPKLNFTSKELDRFISVNPNQSRSNDMPSSSDEPKYTDMSLALMPYENRDLQRIKHCRRRLRQKISTRPKEKKLRTAAGLNNVELVERLLNEGVDPKSTDEKLRTALHIAVSKGYTDIARLLLSHGANPNQKDSIGNTPLHLAASTSHVNIVTLLLKSGADLNQADNMGFPPLHLAYCRLKFLLKDPNPSCSNLGAQVFQIVKMMQEYLNRSGQTEDAEALTSLTSKLSLSDTTSPESETDMKLLMTSLQELALNKTVKTFARSHT